MPVSALPTVHFHHDVHLPASLQCSGSHKLRSFVDGSASAPVWNSLPLDLRAAAHTAHEMQQTILQTIGLTISAGIGRTRLLANLVSPLNKPHGISLLMDSQQAQFMARQPLLQVPGLRGQTGSMIRDSLKIEFVGELAAFTEAELTARLGPRHASFLASLPYGGADVKIEDRGPQKSIAVERSFPPVCSRAALEEIVDSLAEALWTRVVRSHE